jgi:hypothetical protein
VVSSTPRDFENDIIVIENGITGSIGSRVLRRTAVFGLAIAVAAGLATPVFAADGGATPAPAAAPAAVAKATSAAPAAAPTAKDLMPLGKPGHQVSIKANSTQLANAAAIVHTAKSMKLPARAAVIAVATALQESKLHNYGNLGNRNDHDSLGLFQQRPSSGWGTPSQCTNPQHAAKAFLSSLVKVPHWSKMALTHAAQDVQVSAYGDRYAQWEVQAASIVAHYWNPAAPVTAVAAH